MYSTFLLTFSITLVACGDARSEPARADGASAAVSTASAQSATPVVNDAERRLFEDAAQAAWRYLDDNYQPATGLVNATPDWHYTTTWDIGAQILGFLAAKDIGLLPPAEFDRRTQRTLSTLERLELYRGVYTRIYSTRNASVGTPESRHPGWSAMDLGRMFVALKVLATRHPEYAEQIERIVRRTRMSEVVRGGYLHGNLNNRHGRPWTYQEGRIGYEQYAASGFAAWGANVGNAMNLRRNAVPATVMGVPVLADRRWQDRLLSEPFILMGLELGLNGEMRELAANVLRAQQARFDSTGQVTIVSEDAVGIPPHYFYYYCVLCNRKPFIIDVAMPGQGLDSPRWVSTKGAYGWHALMPSDYTRRAVEHVAPARGPRSWASGVFEGTRRSTQTYDVNTASVLLEAAAYRLRGDRPLIEAAGRSTAN